jgi:hypothetical protein
MDISKGDIACALIAPADGKSCVNQNGKCVITVVPTSAPGKCGVRCTTNANCGAGMTCTPIWWPCTDLPISVNNALQANQALDATTVANLIKTCPKYASLLPKQYNSGSKVVMPAFYGVCRKTACVSSADCSCSVVPTPRVITPTPSVTSADKATIKGGFNSPTMLLGSEITAPIIVDSAGKKVSAVNIQVVYDANSFDFVETVPLASANVLKNEVDKTTGKITLYLTWNSPATSLPTDPTIAVVKLKAKKAGVGTLTFTTNYANQVSGLDSNGKSTLFGIAYGTNQSISITSDAKCAICANGQKSKGDANCDGTVDLLDFEYWRSEAFDKGGMTGTTSTTWMSDFSCDSKADLLDFEVWRATVFP